MPASDRATRSDIQQTALQGVQRSHSRMARRDHHPQRARTKTKRQTDKATHTTKRPSHGTAATAPTNQTMNKTGHTKKTLFSLSEALCESTRNTQTYKRTEHKPSLSNASPRRQTRQRHIPKTAEPQQSQRRPAPVDAMRGLSHENTNSTSGSSTSMATRHTPEITNSARRERSARDRSRPRRQG